MNAVSGPGHDIPTEAAELLDQALKGAKVNRRPDLIRRLNRARQTLDTATGAEERIDAGRLVAQDVLRALDSLRVDLRSRRAMLSDPSRTAELRAELADVKARSERFKLVSREWPQTMAYGFAKVSSDIEFDLRCRIRALISDMELAIDASDPGKIRDQLDAKLRGHLVVEADRCYQHVHAGVRDMATEIAALISLPTPHRLPAPPVVPPHHLVATLPDRHRPSPRSPVPATLLTVLLPGYSGIVITLLLSRLLGLHLPGWMIAVCAVVGALALAGAKASGERKRQLDRRRADAAKAMRGTADEFQLALAKQLRDAVRVLEHDLRRATAATVTQLAPSIAEELDTIRATTETAQRAPAELAAIAVDLDTVAELRNRGLELQRATSVVPGPHPVRRRHLTVVV